MSLLPDLASICTDRRCRHAIPIIRWSKISRMSEVMLRTTSLSLIPRRKGCGVCRGIASSSASIYLMFLSAPEGRMMSSSSVSVRNMACFRGSLLIASHRREGSPHSARGYGDRARDGRWGSHVWSRDDAVWHTHRTATRVCHQPQR